MYARRAKPRESRCAICGGEFRSIRSDATTCSARCRKVRWLESLKNLLPRGKDVVHQQICEVCTKDFTSRRSDAKTCSARCRKALSRSATGHLDRLRRVGAALDKAKLRKEFKRFDDLARAEARALGRPLGRKQKTEPASRRRIRQAMERTRHYRNAIKAFERQDGDASSNR